MVSIIGFIILAGGIGHVITGLVIYRPQLTAISNDGFINAVLPHFDRRAALWFILFGVMVAMAGHLLVHAARVADPTAIRIAGWYLLGVSSVGTLTQTRSPSSLSGPFTRTAWPVLLRLSRAHTELLQCVGLVGLLPDTNRRAGSLPTPWFPRGPSVLYQCRASERGERFGFEPQRSSVPLGGCMPAWSSLSVVPSVRLGSCTL